MCRIPMATVSAWAAITRGPWTKLAGSASAKYNSSGSETRKVSADRHEVVGVIAGQQILSPGEVEAQSQHAQFGLQTGIPEPSRASKLSSGVGDFSSVKKWAELYRKKAIA